MRYYRLWAAVAAAGVGVCASVMGSNRPFTYTYTVYPAPAGQVEFEQWAEYKGATPEDSSFNRWNFREELEYAPTDNTSIALYLPNWHYESSSSGSETEIDSLGIEGIWYLTNPVTDSIGIGLYAEATAGREDASIEGKLLLQKDVGNWIFAYNLILETELEDAWESEKQTEGEWGNNFGVAYGFANGLRLGAELTIESEYEQWRLYEGTTVYAGPAISYLGGSFFGTKTDWWVAVTPMFQLTNVEDESRFKTRMIFGLEF